jgi:putative sugar O-methyltransferase
VIEANAILEHIPPSSARPLRIAELGAGYGRLSWALLAARPDARITIIDIPPALHIAEWYFAQLMPADRLFTFREFACYEDIRVDFEAATVRFLLASQVDRLPPDSVDLFVNVASLQEMTPPQIAMWFDEIDRLCAGRFYSKQYAASTNDLDEVCVRREDYPVKPHWRELFSRPCQVQQDLFEAMFDVAG